MSVEKIGRYQITGELGKGAMGVVYTATDPTIGRTVALKTMRLDVHAEKHDEMLRRFQNEARAAGALNHPNIVTIYDAAEADGVFYIAMEFIEGRSLASILHERKTLSANEVVEIGTQVCAGLQYAHFRKVIHRDIKPANIMLTPSNQVKITDFGIAKAGANLTHTGEVVGTPNYMSPEQVKGRELDGRSDIFSSGVMMYEMLTGERPFNGESVTTIIYKIIHENPIPPRELDVSIHSGLSFVVTKCLAKDPEDRYQDASDLSTALRSYKVISVRDNAPVVAPAPPTPPTQLQTRVSPPPTVAATRPVPIFGANKTGATGTHATGAQTTSVSPHDAETISVPVPPKSDPAPHMRKPVVLFAIMAFVMIAAGFLIRWLRTPPSVATTPITPATQSQTPAPPPPPTEANTPPKPPEQRITEAANEIAANARKQAMEQAGLANKAIPPTGIGDLRITSNPAGARVQIDGVSQDWWVTPFNTPPMKAGPHSIIATSPGLPPQTRTVEISPKKKTVVDFQLAGDNAIFNIASVPNGAQISIDGNDIGSRTPAQLMLKAGQHRIKLQLEGFDPTELMATGAAGQEVNIAPQMRARNSVDISGPAPGEVPGLASAMANMKRELQNAGVGGGYGAVLVRTRPKGASVSVEGRQLGRVTPFRFPVKAGTYNITFSMAGFKSVTRSVQVEDGRMTEVDAILVPER